MKELASRILFPFLTIYLINLGDCVINGRDAEATPYQVSIQKNRTHHFGGAIIHPRFVGFCLKI